VARLIVFYIPQKFRPKVKWVPSLERGRIIEFQLAASKKTA
jgi:hypothetical protein